MERTQLFDLFQKYLNRSPSGKEIIIHQKKNYHEFINEISICQEYLELQKTAKLVGGTANTKPKIAILISGHIRNNNINKSFEHLNDYDYDVFIHTWDNFGFKGSETNLEDKVNADLVRNEILKIPNVKSYVIENNKTFIEGLEPVDFNYFNFSSPEVFIKSQLYSISQCYKIFEEYQITNNLKYDLVIRTRFENKFTEFLVDDELLEDLKQKIIFVPNNDCGHEHPDSNSTTCLTCEKMYTQHNLKKVHTFDHTHIICDVFAYGNPKSMKQYCSLYDNYDDLNKSFEKKNHKILNNTDIKHTFKNNVCHLDMTYEGHIDSLYYLNCSYPERLLQFQLRNFLLPMSKKIKIKWDR
jgi:hypothetical protein